MLVPVGQVQQADSGLLVAIPLPIHPPHEVLRQAQHLAGVRRGGNEAPGAGGVVLPGIRLERIGFEPDPDAVGLQGAGEQFLAGALESVATVSWRLRLLSYRSQSVALEKLYQFWVSVACIKFGIAINSTQGSCLGFPLLSDSQ